MIWPALLLAAQVVSAIQIHGNTATPDEDVRRLAAIDVGAEVNDTTVDAVAARLKASKRFDNVQVLKRFASIADPSQVLLVIIVDEGPVRIQMTGDAANPTRVVRSHRPRILVLPILNRQDGYGFTYGARLTRQNVLGTDSRMTFPLTWGGDKHAGIDVEKRIAGAPIDRITGGVSVSRRRNPFFDRNDDRVRASVRLEHEFSQALRIGTSTGVERSDFATFDQRFGRVGADIRYDTRVDPQLPRNAVFGRASWEHLSFGVNRLELDGRGYVGVFGQTVFAVRALRESADGPLPEFLQPLLGGLANVRGYKAGTAAGDTLVAASAELIVPLTSPVKIGKIGVTAFVDSGTVYAFNEHFRDQTMKVGLGGSVWLAAAFFHLNIAVAHGRGSSTRVQAGGNITF